MAKILKILILEDSPEDVDLIERELKRAGMSFESLVVNKRPEFEKALYEARPDVILSDHSLPSFNSIEALKIYKEAQSQLNLAAPFILVTGAVSEEFAVQCIRDGANDYILKDRLKRLPASINNAIEKTRSEAERRRFLDEVISNEAMLKQAEQLAHLGSWEADLLSGVYKWSDEAYNLYGYGRGEVEPSYELFISHVHPEDEENLKTGFQNAILVLDTYEIKFRILTKDRNVKYVNLKLVIKRDARGKPVKLNGFILDITEQTRYIQRIEEQNYSLREIAWMQSHGVRAPLARILGLVSLLDQYKEPETDVPKVLAFIGESVQELDVLVRSVVRKTEELPLS